MVEIVIVAQVQHGDSYELGFVSGSRAAQASREQLEPAKLYLLAINHFHRSELSVVLDRDSFVGGFVDGWHAYFNGLISEREQTHGTNAN